MKRGFIKSAKAPKAEKKPRKKNAFSDEEDDEDDIMDLCEDDDNGVDDEENIDDGFSDDGWDSSQKEMNKLNKAMLLNGDLVVRQEPILNCLKVTDIEAVLRRPFRSPCSEQRTSESDLLLKTKRLGMRRPFAFHTPSEFQKPRTGKAAEEEDSVTEPLILWECTDGTGAEPIQVKAPVLKFLREHQREGVRFMFECVAGLRDYGGQGCILADDMGLGKTLQSISLLWTLLRQGIDGKPMVKKAIVVCPTSLVKNWDNEVKKWLGVRVVVKALNESTKEKVEGGIKEFLSLVPSLRTDVLVISYETFRLHAEKFVHPGSCDLLICDEAHRLKNDQTLTNQTLNNLACRRRILLSGTPMQNDLDEFYAMVNFTNPGILGTTAQFRKKYAGPILTGREPDATESEKQKGDESSQELSSLVNKFILRRTNTLLSEHLPPKIVQVVCVKLTELQANLYKHFARVAVGSATMGKTKDGVSVRVLSSITSLKKLCNHPKLVFDAIKAHEKEAEGFEDFLDMFPADLSNSRSGARADLSGKFALIEALLIRLRKHTRDRIVLVSNYTQTLDVLDKLCRQHGWPCLRLDGSTTIKKRQQLVDKLNDPSSDEFVFLLSSKAGGCGLNMIGANRLVLFDPDWNPATDKQAAARVWRDGQRKQVYIYRFFATGTIEEKIYQRQLSKEGLQTIVVEEKQEINSLSTRDLKDLFKLREDTCSDTLDMLRKEYVARDSEEAKAIAAAAAAAAASTAATASPASSVQNDASDVKNGTPTVQKQVGFPAEGDLRLWGHHPNAQDIPDEMLKRAYEDVGLISFVFSCLVPGKALERK